MTVPAFLAAPGQLAAALDTLAQRDPHLAQALQSVGLPEFEIRPSGFPTLLRAICAQQVSAAAARTIWARIEAAVSPLTPEAFAALGEAGGRAFGLSGRKASYAHGLAAAIASGVLDLDAVHAAPDDEACAALVKVKGIGRWSAEVYLLFALGRTDIFPAQDLALAGMVQRLQGLERRPTPVELTALAQAWRPWRSAAALLLWHAYRAMP